MTPLELVAVPSPDELDPYGYLWANPDVAALQGPRESVAAWHFKHFGSSEGRDQLFLNRLIEMAGRRVKKMERLLARSPGTELDTLVVECCGVDVTLWTTADPRLPVPYENVSANGYDPEVTRWVDENPESLFLDLGAGLRHAYRDNVIYTEIAALPTTDVLCFGDDLPFDDATFDGIICFSVLEHVPSPQAVAAELMRVLRPGGRMVVDWPFLAPLHGYPAHYFNATEQGARATFERPGASVKTSVPPHLHPLFALHWMVREWGTGLTDTPLKQFRETTLGELLDEPDVWQFMGRGWAVHLEEALRPVISAGTRIVVEKSERDETPSS